MKKRDARLKAQAETEAAAKKKAEEAAAKAEPAPEITWDCAECGIHQVKKKGAICPECKAKHKVAAASEPVKILDTAVLETIFKDLQAHHVDLGNWMFRNKKFARSAASHFIDIYRKLKREGYQ